MTKERDPDEIIGVPPEDVGASAPSRILETIVLRFLARVVHADGVVDPRELELLSQIAITMELDPEEARRLLDDELTRGSDPEELARQLPEPLHRRSVYALGCLMALCEGSIAPSEQDVLDGFARGAELDPEEAAAILEDVKRSA